MAAIKVPDFKLYELERKAEEALKRSPQCVRGLRVDIELLIDLNGVRVESYRDLRRKWDTYAFPDITGRFIFVAGALLMPASAFDPRAEAVATECKNAQGEIDAEKLAQMLAHDFDVNYRAARRRLKMRGYHREERLGLNLD